MKLFGKCLDYFFTGVGFGAISYLVILTFVYPGVIPTPTGVISIFIISGLIGLLSMIFTSDLPPLFALIIHLLGTFILFVIMTLINTWPINLITIFIFLIIYLIIWLILLLERRLTINRINSRIKIRKAKNK